LGRVFIRLSVVFVLTSIRTLLCEQELEDACLSLGFGLGVGKSLSDAMLLVRRYLILGVGKLVPIDPVGKSPKCYW
jgi:hypothetical protein